jgi:hypothetical protein
MEQFMQRSKGSAKICDCLLLIADISRDVTRREKDERRKDELLALAGISVVK